VLFKKKMPTPEQVLEVLEPFRNDVAGIVVESTYNCTGMDGLMEKGYPVHLANPGACEQ